MQKGFIRKLPQFSFLLSILLHLLILLGITTVIILQPEEKKKPPHLYIPSYTFTGHITPSLPQKPRPQLSQSEEIKSLPESKYGTKHIMQKSILEMSRQVIQQEHIASAIENMNNEEPILLIGDKDTVADPFLKLMARSLSANLIFPRLEGELGSKGRVLVSFILHPEGYYTDVDVYRSSDNQHFDSAALYAVNKAPNIPGAHMFISKPKHFVVGFIFN